MAGIPVQSFYNNSRQKKGQDAVGENAHPQQSRKGSRVTPVPHASVRTCPAAHLPEMADLKNPMFFRRQGCPGKSHVRCTKCNVFLCLQNQRNCFAEFHKGR
ncbi:hypothetical protein AMECASPLE_033279 [Ameca splendens]|uniref:Uncharacterized protein n=1 Tax=Ameca splendens TaxID=208324 RepID=A0ABV1AE53_9TELE